MRRLLLDLEVTEVTVYRVEIRPGRALRLSLACWTKRKNSEVGFSTVEFNKDLLTNLEVQNVVDVGRGIERDRTKVRGTDCS
jgi:hypothetical protein